MPESKFTDIIAGLYNAKVAGLPLWASGEWWRYDQIDPWHDDVTRIAEEVSRGVVSVLRVGHREPDVPGAALRLHALRLERRAQTYRRQQATLRAKHPLAQLVQAENRARALKHPIRPRVNTWVPSVPTPTDGLRIEMWKAYGDVLARDGVQLIHPAESCRVADATLYKGKSYTDERGKQWHFNGLEWVDA